MPWPHEDFIPTFAAAAGDTDLVERLKKGGELIAKASSTGATTVTFWAIRVHQYKCILH